MRRSIYAFALLLACGPGNVPEPHTPLDAQEQILMHRARALWAEQGLPSPKRCDDNDRPVVISQPSDEEFERRCRKAGPCEKDGPRPCADACYVCTGGTIFSPECTPTLLVHPDRPRDMWRHELLHYFAVCARIPMGDPAHRDERIWKGVLPELESW